MMVVGHNPTQGQAAHRLCGERIGFGEACAALLQAPERLRRWEDAPAGVGEFELVHFLRP